MMTALESLRLGPRNVDINFLESKSVLHQVQVFLKLLSHFDVRQLAMAFTGLLFGTLILGLLMTDDILELVAENLTLKQLSLDVGLVVFKDLGLFFLVDVVFLYLQLLLFLQVLEYFQFIINIQFWLFHTFYFFSTTSARVHV